MASVEDCSKTVSRGGDVPDPGCPCNDMPNQVDIEGQQMHKKKEQQVDCKAKCCRICLALCAFLLLFFASSLLGLLTLTLLWKGSIDTGAHLTTVATLVLIITVPCCARCCDKKSYLQSNLWRFVSVCAPLMGLLSFVILFLVLFYTDFKLELNTTFDVSQPVAVVGSGPSGLTAAWLLAKSGRRVLILESTNDIGGHSKVWDEGQFAVDIGFIFNNDGYKQYVRMADHFGYPLVDTALNTSRAWNGRYWDNTHAEPENEDIEDDIDRFMAFVEEEPSTMRYITPLGAFLWWHGFSEAFFRLCMQSTLSVLFVTKMGLLRQSAQATLDYFKDNGFTHLRFDKNKVQYNQKGSQNMWRDIIMDMNSTGLVDVQLNSKLVGMQREADTWTLKLSDGRQVAGFADVVLAVPANVAAQILHNPMQKLLLQQIDYIDTYLTLHTDRDATVGQDGFAKASLNVAYFVDDKAMTGKIGQIFGNYSSDLLLTVHEDKGIIDEGNVKVQYVWSHHHFSLWELAVARKFVPMFNAQHGIHLAGDWVFGVGHNDAIKSGIAAACTVGIPEQLPQGNPSKSLYEDLLQLSNCTSKDSAA